MENVNRNETKVRKVRTPKLKLTKDGIQNTKLVASDAMELIQAGYKRMLQILNGKKVRKGSDGTTTEYPLSPMSDARREWIEDFLANIHANTFEQLKNGRRAAASLPTMPD